MYHLSAALWAILAAAPLLAQTDWDRLREIRPDERISAITQSGRYVQGRFRTWTPDAVEIDTSRRSEWIRPVEVKRVWVERKSPRWRAAVIGAAIGFGAAFPIGAASAGYLSDQNNPRFSTRAGFGAGLGLFGAGIGAGIGALVGGSKNELVYRGDRK